MKFPEDVTVKVNEKECFNNELMKSWVEDIWKQRKHNPDPDKSLVIMDYALAHLRDDTHEELKKASKGAIIPGGLTKFAHPLDVSVDKPFKDNPRTC